MSLKKIDPSQAKTWTPSMVKATVQDVLDDEQPAPGLTAAPAAEEEVGSSGDEYLGDTMTSLAYERMGEPEDEPDYPLEVSQFYMKLREANPHLPEVDYVLTEPITLEITADGFHSLTLSVLVKLPDLG